MFILQPGLLKKVQGMGWYLEESNLAQVSTNILDFELTPMHTVYEEICRDAKVSFIINQPNQIRNRIKSESQYVSLSRI